MSVTIIVNQILTKSASRVQDGVLNRDPTARVVAKWLSINSLAGVAGSRGLRRHGTHLAS
jgi:hypothetical protein